MEISKKLTFQLLEAFVKANPDFVFLENDEETYTISEFLNTICNTANLLSRNGVKKGDIVSILCKKDIATIIYLFACQMMGAVALMVDKSQNIEELERENAFKVKYRVIENREVKKTFIFPMISYDVWYDSKDTTIAIATSGSTGERKIVKLSQYAFINNAFDSALFGGYSLDDVALAFLPLNHVFAIAMLFTAICFHFKVVVAKDSDISTLLQCVEKYQVTRFNGVPSIFLKMVELKDNYNLSSLKCAYIGGASCSYNDYLKIEKNLGIKLICVYGMTECIGISTGSFADDSILLANSVGRIYPYNDVKIATDGEIMVKGPSMCNGYYKGELLLKDGYLLTGDIGKIENGFLHIEGRKKEIIIRNGVNISINEIENKLSNIAVFKSYAVVAINDKETGEAPALVAVLNKKISENEVYIELEKYLNKFEMPKKILYIDAIPLLDNGKIDKSTIKKLFI